MKNITIDKVITKLVNYDDMSRIADFETTDYWADLQHIIDYDLQDLLNINELEILKAGQADYIAFRLDN